MRVDANANYLTDVLPGDPGLRSRPVGDGRAADRDSAQLGRRRTASGSPRGSTTASRGSPGVLAIAIFGALIAGKFTSTVDDNLSGTQPLPAGAERGRKAKDKPLERRRHGRSAADRGRRGRRCRHRTPAPRTLPPRDRGRRASLMIVGGVIAGIGLRNPSRETDYEAPRRRHSRGVRPLPRITSDGTEPRG